jgi:hypothetical protein
MFVSRALELAPFMDATLDVSKVPGKMKASVLAEALKKRPRDSA